MATGSGKTYTAITFIYRNGTNTVISEMNEVLAV
jgi:superfamily II DNA or RNA helicase